MPILKEINSQKIKIGSNNRTTFPEICDLKGSSKVRLSLLRHFGRSKSGEGFHNVAHSLLTLPLVQECQRLVSGHHHHLKPGYIADFIVGQEVRV